MAAETFEVVRVLRHTAEILTSREDYQWGHMGACNCGFLAQQITRLRKSEIHQFAMQRTGDWSEQLNDYCPTSGYAMDGLISEMIAFGFNRADLTHLERLSDPLVLAMLPGERKYLAHNVKSDVILYLKLWADMLEAKLLTSVDISPLLPFKMEA